MGEKINSGLVFERIRALYGLPSDAAMARKLEVFPQDIPRFRKSDTLPYKQILNTCPPGDWPMIFLGEPAQSAGTVEAALKTLVDAGYDVTIRRH